MKDSLKKICLNLLLALPLYVWAGPFTGVEGLMTRRVPWLAGHVRFEKIDKEKGSDVMELETVGKGLVIRASGENAAAAGLNWYLKYYCHRSMSHMGDNLSPVGELPVVEKKLRIVSPFPVRYALNYCTISYTMSFYSWKDWERELDWMALNGVNLLLMPVGMEAVWQSTLKQLHFTDKEIADFIPGPAFSAWWLMGNLEGWGGPVTQGMIDRQADLEKMILQRMKGLGIEPVMQGFYGMVPTTLKKKMPVKVIEQGKWAGGFQRPDFLLPSDSAFGMIAGIYYTEMKKLYGGDIHYFGGDPFHEGGSSKGADLTASARTIQQVMQTYYPGSTWVLQGWQENPSGALLQGLDRSKTIVIELFGENTNNWERRKGYDGTPFVWSNVSNFGEKTGLYGRLQRFADEVYRAKNGPYGQFLTGIGVIPEGIDNNPVAYDLMLELGWHREHVDVRNWIKQYTQYRYGKTTAALDSAWAILLETVYSSPAAYQEGPSESILCARPAVGIESVSSWGTRKRNYDTARLADAVRLFASVSVSASADLAQSETYQVDRADLERQLRANQGDMVYQAMMDAIKAGDRPAFEMASERFLQMIRSQDSLLSRNRYFSLSRWLQQADQFGHTPQEKAIALQNAKMQITYWGPDDPTTNLRDYAHKEWGGLLGSLYLERWKAFVNETIGRMNGESVRRSDYFGMEQAWTRKKDLY
jgi:alpha-N-acetylglucosaminidase